MSGTASDFEQLMERVRTGDPEVGRELFERYGKAIQMVVRFRLDRRLRSQYDSLDFAQDAWASFFRLPAENYTFQTPEELVAFLVRVVQYKVNDAFRKGCKGNKNRERKFRCRRSYTDEQPARQPTPSQVASVREEWSRLLEDKPPKIRRILEMLRDGYTQREIALRLDTNVRRIRRLLKSLNDGRTRSLRD
jgi:RNA polymerase sigma factor (sigma-70 family)